MEPENKTTPPTPITTSSSFSFRAVGVEPLNRSYTFTVEEKDITAARNALVIDLQKLICDLETMELPAAVTFG